MANFRTKRDLDKSAADKEAQIYGLGRTMFGPNADNDNDPQAKAKAKVIMAAPMLDPFAIDNVGGLMGDCARWIFETSRTPIEEFCVLASIATFAALFGRRCVGPTGSGLNIYLVIVAGTGFGKNKPLQSPASILRAVSMPRLIGPPNVTGDSAIERALRQSPCCVMLMDEFGLILQGATSRTAPAWTQTIRRALLELYSRSGPDETWKAKLHADLKSDAQPIEQPTLSILGATTPQEFYDGLTTSAASNGLLNRLVVISVEKRPDDQDVEAISKFPTELAERVKAALSSFPCQDSNLARSATVDATRPAQMVVVPYRDDAAKARFQKALSDQRRILDSETDMSGLADRAAESTIKLATLRAISRDPGAPAVTADDVEWGWAIVYRSIQTVSGGVERYMAGSQAEALRKLIAGYVVDAGAKGLAKSKLMEKRGMSAAGYALDDAVTYLCQQGRIKNVGKTDARGGRGRSGERYVAREFLLAT